MKMSWEFAETGGKADYPRQESNTLQKAGASFLFTKSAAESAAFSARALDAIKTLAEECGIDPAKLAAAVLMLR
jgi:hypothetical protein